MNDLKTLLEQIDKFSKCEVKSIASALKGSNYHSDLFEKCSDIKISPSKDLVMLEAKLGGLYIFTIKNTVADVDIIEFNDVKKATKLKRKKIYLLFLLKKATHYM